MTDTVILVRHAEYTAGVGTDPPLDPVGLDRAEQLSRVLYDAGIGAIFVSSSQRTQQTAQPLADKLKIKPEVVDQLHVNVAVDQIRQLSASSTALVIGH